MSSRRGPRFGDEKLEGIKVISGWCIEARRIRDGVRQKNLAKKVGVAVRWLREIESGSPRTTVDDHLRCAWALGFTTGYMFIPTLYEERGRVFPRDLLLSALGPLEDRCVDAIATAPIEVLVRHQPVQP